MTMGPDVNTFRDEMMDEVEELIEDLEDEQSAWFATCRPHVKAVYEKMPTGVPQVTAFFFSPGHHQIARTTGPGERPHDRV